MKQQERKCFPIGSGAGIIMECSFNCAKVKIPRLTIMLPFWPGNAEEPSTPAQSIELSSNMTTELYTALKEYFEEKENEPKPT